MTRSSLRRSLGGLEADVGDEPIVLTSLREQFERPLLGFEVEVAQEATEALCRPRERSANLR